MLVNYVNIIILSLTLRLWQTADWTRPIMKKRRNLLTYSPSILINYLYRKTHNHSSHGHRFNNTMYDVGANWKSYHMRYLGFLLFKDAHAIRCTITSCRNVFFITIILKAIIYKLPQPHHLVFLFQLFSHTNKSLKITIQNKQLQLVGVWIGEYFVVSGLYMRS